MKEQWQANQTLLGSFDTVEDFWRLYNHIQVPSRIMHADLSVFRSGISPAWEDPCLKHGGRFVAMGGKTPLIDHIWETLVLSVIGEQFGESWKYVCGVVVSIRRTCLKVALWVSSSDVAVLRNIEVLFKTIVQQGANGCDSMTVCEALSVESSCLDQPNESKGGDENVKNSSSQWPTKIVFDAFSASANEEKGMNATTNAAKSTVPSTEVEPQSVTA